MFDATNLLTDESVVQVFKRRLEGALNDYILDGWRVRKSRLFDLRVEISEVINDCLSWLEEIDFDYTCVVGVNEWREDNGNNIIAYLQGNPSVEIVEITEHRTWVEVEYFLSGVRKFQYVFYGRGIEEALWSSIVSIKPMTYAQAQRAYWLATNA